MTSIVEKVRNELQNASDANIQRSTRQFFKEAIASHGVKSASVTKIGQTHFKQVAGLPKRAILDLCEELWQSGFLEEAIIACSWAYRIHRKYEPADLAVFERWVNTYVSNWASCDTLCNHAVGQLIEMYPDRTGELKRWATQGNRWMRRGAAVSLVIPARKGLFLPDIFDIANILLLDSDDLVQKGYGWMLKAASQSNQRAVFDYVMSQKQVMPRVALRYAIEKMPRELKAAAMARREGKNSGFRKN